MAPTEKTSQLVANNECGLTKPMPSIQLSNSRTESSFLDKFYAHGFYLFFIAPIFSPSIHNTTIYLETLFIILNPNFLKYATQIKYNLGYVGVFSALVALSILTDVINTLKLIQLILTVTYLAYTYEKKIFYFFSYLKLSIALAIVQFAFLYIDPSVSTMLGPQNISKAIWGSEFATQTNTNFYSILGISRVSGTERESGFLAALILCAGVTLYFMPEKAFKSWQNWASVIAGFIISFSKMSLLALPVMLIIALRKKINLLPVFFPALLFFGANYIYWNSHIEFLADPLNRTFLHRFGGYVMLKDESWQQLLFGVNSTDDIHSYLANIAASNGYDQMTGLAGFVISNGIIYTMAFFGILSIIGATAFSLLLLLLLTSDVTLNTNQNFVSVAFFCVLFILQKRSNSRRKAIFN